MMLKSCPLCCGATAQGTLLCEKKYPPRALVSGIFVSQMGAFVNYFTELTYAGTSHSEYMFIFFSLPALQRPIFTEVVISGHYIGLLTAFMH